MNPLKRKFLHDLQNKLSRIDGFIEMIKDPMSPQYQIILKMEKAKNEAFDIIKEYETQQKE